MLLRAAGWLLLVLVAAAVFGASVVWRFGRALADAENGEDERCDDW